MANDEWGTPEWLYRALDHEFGFTVDVCASEENHKHERYFTKEQDGLAQPWYNERAFCNPPYSNILPWVEKMLLEPTIGVIVLPFQVSRIGTKWLRLLHENSLHVEFRAFHRRVPFVRDGQEVQGTPFDTLVAVVRR